MTLNKINSLINNVVANNGAIKLHLILNARTLHSLLRDIEDSLYVVDYLSRSIDNSTIRILGYPTYINDQVPFGEVYVMEGEKPKDS